MQSDLISTMDFLTKEQHIMHNSPPLLIVDYYSPHSKTLSDIAFAVLRVPLFCVSKNRLQKVEKRGKGGEKGFFEGNCRYAVLEHWCCTR